MSRLYANENFALPVVEELRRLGHDEGKSSSAGRKMCSPSQSLRIALS